MYQRLPILLVTIICAVVLLSSMPTYGQQTNGDNIDAGVQQLSFLAEASKHLEPYSGTNENNDIQTFAGIGGVDLDSNEGVVSFEETDNDQDADDEKEEQEMLELNEMENNDNDEDDEDTAMVELDDDSTTTTIDDQEEAGRPRLSNVAEHNLNERSLLQEKERFFSELLGAGLTTLTQMSNPQMGGAGMMGRGGGAPGMPGPGGMQPGVAGYRTPGYPGASTSALQLSGLLVSGLALFSLV